MNVGRGLLRRVTSRLDDVPSSYPITYSVDGIKSGQLLLTYMPLKIQQSLAVGEE